MNVLLSTLLAHCEKNLRATVPDGRLLNAAEVRDDILGEFGVLFTEDGSAGHLDVLDYFECRFNRAFLTLRIDMVRIASVGPSFSMIGTGGRGPNKSWLSSTSLTT